MSEDRRLCGRGQRIVNGLASTLRPFRNGVGDIFHQVMGAALSVMVVRGPLLLHEDMAFVGYSQRVLQGAENYLLDVGIGVGVLIDEDSFRPGLIGAGERKMA